MNRASTGEPIPYDALAYRARLAAEHRRMMGDASGANAELRFAVWCENRAGMLARLKPGEPPIPGVTK